MASLFHSKLFVVVFLFGSLLPTVVTATSKLVYKEGSANCHGGTTSWDITNFHVNCGYGECTYGSVAHIYGQIETYDDLPKYSHITIRTKVFPLGIHQVYSDTKQICAANVLMPPEGDDASYKCPSAGIYNFHTSIRLHGDEYSWYSELYGFNTGFVLTIQDPSYPDVNLVQCTLNVQVRKGYDKYDIPGNYMYGATVGVIGLVLYGLRRRRLNATTTSGQSEEEERTTTVQFEMMTDLPPTVLSSQFVAREQLQQQQVAVC